MKGFILRPNGATVYGFLSLANARLDDGETLQDRKILDCGAGGSNPPLALFQQHGLKCFGIDRSPEQLTKAVDFCRQQEIEIDFREGDMRQIPFEDGTFDFVYEHYSMCHLNKEDTALAVSEMKRVLKPGGLCFLGLISTETWPKSLFGEEKLPGEFWGEEGGRESVRHSLFTDQEADQSVTDWRILGREKHVTYLQNVAEEVTIENWMEMLKESDGEHSKEEWKAKYTKRSNSFQYIHLYYYLMKPE